MVDYGVVEKYINITQYAVAFILKKRTISCGTKPGNSYVTFC